MPRLHDGLAFFHFRGDELSMPPEQRVGVTIAATHLTLLDPVITPRSQPPTVLIGQVRASPF